MMETKKKKDPRQQYKGYVNHEKGQTFEKIIEAACREYSLKGAANIEKTPEPMRVIKRLDKGRFVAVFEKKAQPDFKGTLDGGQTVVFEAKSSEGDRILQRAVTPTQTESLNIHWAMGATVFVLVCMNRETYYRVPWEVWRKMKTHYGRLYMNLEELKAFEITFDLTLKFLQGVNRYGHAARF